MITIRELMLELLEELENPERGDTSWPLHRLPAAH